MRALLAGTLLVASACAPKVVVFPTGAGVPIPDALQVWWTATDACTGAQVFSAEIQVSGRIGAEKLPRVTLQGAMTRKGEIRLLAVAPAGPPIFVLAGRAEHATLTLPRDRRVLTAPAADIIDALIGLRLSPEDWLNILSGCVTSARPADGVLIGRDTVISMERGAGRVLLRKDGTVLRIVAGERPDLLVEYREFQGRWPSIVTLSSRSVATVNVGLNLTISQIFVNTAIDPRAFALDVPADFRPMTLDELRAIGPLGAGRSGDATQGKR